MKSIAYAIVVAAGLVLVGFGLSDEVRLVGACWVSACGLALLIRDEK